MRLNELRIDSRLAELVPPLGTAAPGTVPTTGAAPAPGVKAAPGTVPGTADPQAQQKMMAAQAVQMAERRKQIQDDIKNKQKEIQDLQKELAMLK
jgi:hypothetical protein